VSRRVGLPLDITLKVLVIGLTAFGAFSGLESFEDKGFGWRLLFYPVMIFALPVIWRFVGHGPYPYTADVLITLPFLADVVGNVLNLYDTIDWWDDVNHLANAYTDTLGDLTLDLCGTLIAAGITYYAARRRARESPGQAIDVSTPAISTASASRN
jgi:hypothetical protein